MNALQRHIVAESRDVVVVLSQGNPRESGGANLPYFLGETGPQE